MANELVIVSRQVLTSANTNTSRATRMTIQSDSGESIVFIPYAPVEVSHGDRGITLSRLARHGLVDAVYKNSPKLNTMSFSLMVADKQVYRSPNPFESPTLITAVGVLQALDNFAATATRVRVTYASFESGLWYINSLSFKSKRRHPLTDEITQATVDLEFIKAADAPSAVGPLTGGVRPVSTPVIAGPPQQAGVPPWVVRAGDTCWTISVAVYGTGARWMDIADLNGVADPRNLPIGVALRMPPR